MTAWMVITIFARPPLPLFVGGAFVAPAPGGGILLRMLTEGLFVGSNR